MHPPEGPSAPKDDEGESVVVETGDVALHTVQAGSESDPLAVLLHGFPEFWYCWHDQIRPLVAAGYRVVVPDQRGYNFSDRPDGVDAYRIDALADDVTGLLDALDRDVAHLVGHDLGAAVAWWTALHRPERVETLTTVNVPHPTVMADTLRRSWRQRLRSWYALLFQLPALPERVARVGNWAPLVGTMRRTSLPGTFSTAEFDRYRAAWGQPGAFGAMLNWYRAVGRRRDEPRRTTVEVPTLVVWGGRDGFLERSMAHESVTHCRNGRVAMVDDATHWVQHEHPSRVADLLLDQFA